MKIHSGDVFLGKKVRIKFSECIRNAFLSAFLASTLQDVAFNTLGMGSLATEILQQFGWLVSFRKMVNRQSVI